MADLQHFNYSKDGGDDHLEKWRHTSGLAFLDPECFPWSVYQISSKSGDKWPNKSISMIFETVAAAILENGGAFPVLRFLDSACFN